jgi:hypothetical protein
MPVGTPPVKFGTPPVKLSIANLKPEVDNHLVEGTAEDDGLEP